MTLMTRRGENVLKKISFHQGWTVSEGVRDPFDDVMGRSSVKVPVMLPQDAMICEERDRNCESGCQSGFYPAKTYTYEKEFFVPADWKDRQTYIEFEGVMRQAMVYLNGEFLKGNKNGYLPFFVDLNPYLRYGRQNTLKVIAINEEKSSRWYSGGGIYRDVHLYQGELIHVVPEGLRVTTEDISDGWALLSVDVTLENRSTRAADIRLNCRILNAMENEVSAENNIVSLLPLERTTSHFRISVAEARCWSTKDPYLYHCSVMLSEHEDFPEGKRVSKSLDTWEESFGIRTVRVDSVRGLQINGEPVKLRGACIHHDNGILGATTLRCAEEFRLKKLKEAGFNSIRSAHHPAGKDLLELCDRMGILVMDELTDMWDQPKNVHDQALIFDDEWKDWAERMAAKDYNHPSVILYSLGNEIPEIGRRSGARRNRQIANELRKLDPTRFVTGGFSGFLAAADAIGEMAKQMGASEERAEEEKPEMTETVGSEGSEGMNAAMGKTQEDVLDQFSVSPILSECLEEASCELDVVGYNYLTARHELEHELHPGRVVVGSETYPPQIARLWKIVRENTHVIGDFTWTGYDYLGEAGIGIYHYDSDRQQQGRYPDRLAYCGDINLNGYRRPLSYLREIVYGLRKEPFLAVERLDRQGHRVVLNNWQYADALDSWTYEREYEGKKAIVHVFSASEEVELFLNGRSLGRKAAGEKAGYDTVYQVSYEPGRLMAAGYSGDRETGRHVLCTADKPVEFFVQADKLSLRSGGKDAVFLTVELLDKNGTVNRRTEREVTVTLEGPGILAALGSADPCAEGSYQSNRCRTFDGRVLAVVRSTEQEGDILVRLTAEGCAERELHLKATYEKQ